MKNFCSIGVHQLKTMLYIFACVKQKQMLYWNIVYLRLFNYCEYVIVIEMMHVIIIS
jgi:hypothetical protein